MSTYTEVEKPDDQTTMIQRLTAAVRESTGYERTPGEVLESLKQRGVKNIARAAKQILESHDLVMAFSRELRSEDQDSILEFKFAC